MARNKKVEVKLVVDSRGVVRAVDKATGRFVKMENQATRSTRSVTRGFRNMQGAIAGMAGAVGLGLLARSVIDTGRAFESEMARVGALTQATGEEFTKLNKLARDLGASTVFSATEAAQGMQFLAMAGFETNEIVQAMPGLLDLAAAGQIELADAADITSNVLSGFGLSAAEAGRLADVLAKTSISANTNIQQLGEAMKFVAPVAATLGLEAEELSAAIGIMGDAGIQGSLAGTSLRMSLLKMAAPMRRGQKVMDEIGFSASNADGTMKSLTQIIGELTEKTAHMTEVDRTAAVAKLVGAEAVSGFLALMERGADDIASFTEELENAGGTAQEVALQQLDTLDGAIRILQSSLQNLQIEAFTQMKDELTQSIREVQQVTSDPRTTQFAAEVGEAVGTMIVWLSKGFKSLGDFSVFLRVQLRQAFINLRNTQIKIIEVMQKMQNGLATAASALGMDGFAGKMREASRESEYTILALRAMIDGEHQLMEEIRNGAPVIDEQTAAIKTQTDVLDENTEALKRNAGAKGAGGPAPTRPSIEVVGQEDKAFTLDDEIEAAGRYRSAMLDLIGEVNGLGESLDLVTEKTEENEDAATGAQAAFSSYTTGAITSLSELSGAVRDFTMQFIQAKLNEAIAGSAAHEFSTKGLFGAITAGLAVGAVKIFFDNLPGFADGVTGFGGGVALVGERGPELVTMGQGSNVITNENTQRLLSRFDQISSPVNNITTDNSDVAAAIREQTEVLANRPIPVDYFGLKDGLTRHDRHQKLIGNTE